MWGEEANLPFAKLPYFNFTQYKTSTSLSTGRDFPNDKPLYQPTLD